MDVETKASARVTSIANGALALRSTIVIPARLASTRLPRKLLLRETGRSLLQHTYEAASKATRPSGVLVAADCDEIATVVRGFGGCVELTSPDCASGTDRVAEIARRLPEVDVLVNVQGDEPEISAAAIDLAVELLERDQTAVMSTLATPIRTKEKLHDPACVKVIFDQRKRAIYFSRAPIPFARNWDDSLLTAEPPPVPLRSSDSVASFRSYPAAAGWSPSADRATNRADQVGNKMAM
jgi:3-deoxy-manno-octulosonate cytidylyltransferase (CMP-KDO synthetase)